MVKNTRVSFTAEEEADDSHDFSKHEHPPSPPPTRTASPPPPRSSSGLSTGSVQYKNLRSNLMREQRDRNPLFHYEVVSTLGVGSMGSVAKVRKRATALGGSARKDFQDAVKEHRRRKECLQLPFIGNIFRFCIDPELKPKHVKSESSSSTRDRSSSRDSSILAPAGGPPVSFSINSIASFVTNSDGNASRSGDENSVASNTSTRSLYYAMKSIHLSRISDPVFLEELKNEIDILRHLDHPNIVRAHETFTHRNQIFVVCELLTGGDLYARDPYTEPEAARITSQILSAVSFMHSKNIAHRDIKYENIMFTDESPRAEVKLIDFGLSKVYGDNAQLTEGVGTIYTMSPEVLKGNYTQSADLWSVGVVTFMLLSSQMPFYGRKRRHIAEQILSGQYDFRGRRWKRVSEPAKAFVQELLVLDPEERATANEALSHTWLNKRFAATTRAPLAQEEDEARLAMIRYSGYNKLKKMALMVVAHKSSVEEIGILRKVFKKYDSRGDGSISFEEFCEALSQSGHSKEDLKNMFEAVDLDGTGRIKYTEFLAATIEAQGAISEERLAEAFDRLDSDDSGYISAENLAEILGSDFPAEEIQEIIREADLTKDNQISYSEFLALWENRHEKEREAQLRLLGPPQPSLGSSVELTRSMSDELGPVGESRANFIAEKHRQTDPRKVDFSDTVVAIVDETP